MLIYDLLYAGCIDTAIGVFWMDFVVETMESMAKIIEITLISPCEFG
jgi:hypothetical protein